MTCPNCGKDGMVQSRAGWLCLSCGHLERDKSATVAARAPEPKPDAPAEPTPEVLVAESAPGVPAPPTLPLNGKPPLKPTTHPRQMRPVATLAVTLAVLVGIVGSAAAYLLMYQPKTALADYAKRIATAKTTVFNATGTGQAVGLTYAVGAQGVAAYETAAKAKVSLTASGSIKPMIGEPIELSTDFIATEGKTYIKGQSALGSLGWVSSGLASSLGRCLGSEQALNAAITNAATVRPPVTGSSFVGLDTIKGDRMLHFRGKIDSTKLQAYIDALTKGLPSGCRVDVAELEVSYDVWRGLSADRLKLSIVNTLTQQTLSLTIDTGSYGKAVNIQAPSGESLAGTATPSPSPSASATPTPAPATASDAAARDAERKAGLAAYVAAFRATASNGYYPTNPKAVSVTAKDPTTGQAYQVSRSKVSALGQIEYRAGGRCTAPDITPGAASTRYVALHMKLEGQADYCLDVK